MAQPTKQAERAYLARIIAGAPLFQTTARDDIEELVRCSRSLAVARGKTIERPKGKEIELYIVEHGAAALLGGSSQDDKSLLITLMGPGGVIGLVKAIAELSGRDARNMGDWRALSNLTLVAIPIPDFLRVMRRSPELTMAAIITLGRLLEHMTHRFAAEMRNPLEMRLASFLEQLGAIAAGNDWEPTVNLGRLQQTQIAELLGVSREHINRTLIMWEKSGLVFQSKGGDLLIQNRKRLAQLSGSVHPNGRAPADHDRLWEIEAHINLGLNAAAHDLAMEGAMRSPRDDRFKYFAVLAMARMGALGEALSLAEAFKLSTDAQNEDIASIGPRLRRDLAFAADGGPDKAQLKLAAEGYEKVFNALKTTYPGVNAAATYAMSGDLDRARKIASEVRRKAEAALGDTDEDEPSYWSRATLAECLLLEGKLSQASANFAAAVSAIDAAPGKVATTRRQLRRLKEAFGYDDAWIDCTLPQGSVLYFCGPLTPAGGATQPALNHLKRRFSEFLERRNFVAAIGALAAGADIVIAETLLDAGVALHAHLPCPPGDFLTSSVAPSGDKWRERFISCVERAQTIEWMRRIAPSHAAYRLGGRVAMGRAKRLAAELSTEPFGFFSQQRGRTPQNSVSRENAEIWSGLGLKSEIFEDDWLATSSTLTAESAQDYLAAVIAQGKGAASLDKIVNIAPSFAAETSGLAVLACRTLQEAIAAMRQIRQSPVGESLRLWLDVGIGEKNGNSGADFAATLVTASCRPQTAAGKVYASETFVNATASTPGQRPRFEYVGFAPTEEKLDPCPLFLTDV